MKRLGLHETQNDQLAQKALISVTLLATNRHTSSLLRMRAQERSVLPKTAAAAAMMLLAA